MKGKLRLRKSSMKILARSTRNESEKIRRAYLRHCLDELKRVLPLSQYSPNSTAALLKEAHHFIKELEECYRKKQNCLRELIQEQDRLLDQQQLLGRGEVHRRGNHVLSKGSSCSLVSSRSFGFSERDDKTRDEYDCVSNEDDFEFNMSTSLGLGPYPLRSSENSLLCMKDEESATKYVKPSKLQGYTKIKPEFLYGSASHSCFNAELNDVDEIRSKMKIEPLFSNYKEEPFDSKLLLKPVVVLEKINPSHSGFIHSGKSIHVNKVLTKREGFVEKLKKELETLKKNLEMDIVQPEKNYNIIGLADLKQKKLQARKRKVVSTKASDWIKVEDVSDLPNKKIYYIYRGENCEDFGDDATAVDDKPSTVADCKNVICLRAKKDNNKRSRFRCSLCRKTCGTESALKAHITVVHNKMRNIENKSYIKRNICPLCHKRCNYRHTLEDHLMLHECPAYGCAGCKASFVEFGTLKLHLPCPKVAERMPAYLCLLCQETFFIGNDLRKHVQFTHCKKATIPNAYRKPYIFSQVQNTDGNNEERFECNKCGKKFRFRESMKKHLPCGVKTCSICGKLFEKETKLKAHVRLFHNDQAVECLICNRRFEKQRNLDAHQSKFQGQCVNKVHVCGYCGLAFGSPERLMVHVASHEKFSERCKCIFE